MKSIETSSNLFLRLNAWFQERFPIGTVITGILIYVSCKIILFTPVGGSTSWSFSDIAGGLMIAFHFLILRIFDEFKDYEYDKIYNPERIVQKGIIKLNELKILGLIAFALQLVCFSLVSELKISATLAFSFLWIWTLLMFKEFFIKEYLKPKLLLYSFLHLLVSPLLVVVIYFSLNRSESLSPVLYSLFGLNLLTGFLYEISRKLKGIEEDQKGSLSFSEIYGRSISSAFLSLSYFLTLVLGYYLFSQVGLQNYRILWVCIVILFVFGFVVSLNAYLKQPTKKTRKWLEANTGLLTFTLYLLPMILLIMNSIHTWGNY